jgi:hypothetical protein
MGEGGGGAGGGYEPAGGGAGGWLKATWEVDAAEANRHPCLPYAAQTPGARWARYRRSPCRHRRCRRRSRSPVAAGGAAGASSQRGSGQGKGKR